MSLVAAGQAIARSQPERSDLQQRARLVLQAMGTDLREAGAGLEHGPLPGPLVRYFPPIAPSADGGITVWRVTSRDAQATPVMAIGGGATVVALDDAIGCPAGESACAFSPNTTAIAFTPAGCRTGLRIGSVSTTTLQLSAPLAGCELDAQSAVAEGMVRTYHVDSATRQLLRRDEVTGSTAPMIDGVAAMVVEYFADAGGTEAIAGTTDSELMRLRRVRVTLRLVASNPLLRIPDLTLAVDVAPPNLGGG